MLAVGRGPSSLPVTHGRRVKGIHGNGVLIYIDDFLAVYYSETVEHSALRYYGKSVRKIVETWNLFTPAKMRRMGGESVKLFGFVDFRKESISFGGENSGAKRI